MNRYICVYYNNKDDGVIKKIKEKYNKNLYEFHKRFTRLRTNVNKKYKKLEIKLKGFDGTVKKTYNKFEPKLILKDIDSMPMGHLRKNVKSLSLYADYKPKTTVKGLGFKDKAKAEYTINVIKDMDYNYQMNVINTMINRAMHHPHVNENMKQAIKIFENYKKKLMKMKIKKN